MKTNMEAIVAYFLPLFLLPISLYLFSIIWRNTSDDRKNLPPGSRGWPILGENLKFSLSREKFVLERMSKYSPDVFQTSLLGEKIATFCGPKGNKFLFTHDNKLLTSWFPQSMKKVLSFPEIIKSNADAYSAFKRVLHRDVFSPEALKKHVPTMDALAREHMARDWRPNSVVKVLPLSKKYTFELACRLFLSEVDPDRVKKLSEPFAVVTEGMFSVPVDLPGTAYRRAIRAGEVMREELMRMVGERREERNEEEGEGEDFLSKMVMERDGDGEFLSDKEICIRVVSLLLASYDTTSSAITCVMSHLVQFPHIYDEVIKGNVLFVMYYLHPPLIDTS